MPDRWTLLGIICLVSLIASSISLGIGYERKNGECNFKYLGCWRAVTDTNRAISIRVEGQSIEEIIDTARHEICHEIDYRLKPEDYWNKTTEEKEEFAEKCNPNDYLDKPIQEKIPLYYDIDEPDKMLIKNKDGEFEEWSGTN